MIELEKKFGVRSAIDFVVSGSEEGCAEFRIEGVGASVCGEDADHHALVALGLGEFGACGDEGSSVALAVVFGVDIEGGEHVGVGPVGLDQVRE